MSEESSQPVGPPAPNPAVEIHNPAVTSLADFYADRKLMWRNVKWITFGHFGTALSMTILEPLMYLRLKAVGVSLSGIGLLTSANLWGVSFLVIYFSWKSDHCTSRLGRRTPYVLFALPFITVALLVFPMSSEKWLLIGLMVIYYFFNDMKASTYPLLQIDCVSQEVFARVAGIVAIIIALAGFLSARIGSRMAELNQKRLFDIAVSVMVAATLLALYRIKEPPFHHPAEGRFNLLAPIKVALQDKRILVLMIAVALLNAFTMVFNTWVWFYAKLKLDLTISGTGAAMSWGLLLKIAVSYPAGWLIDRFGSYVALCIEWTLMLALVLCSAHVSTSGGLIVLMVLFSSSTSLQIAGDTILWKTMSKADTGSYTATVALVRNFCTGTVIFISGYLIKWTGSYVVAFWFGFLLSTVALVVFFIYRHIMRRSGSAVSVIPDVGGDSGINGEPIATT